MLGSTTAYAKIVALPTNFFMNKKIKNKYKRQKNVSVQRNLYTLKTKA